jgi:hypothetical protein
VESNSVPARRESSPRSLLARIYWLTAAILILSGAMAAIGLVALFLFPFLPIIGFFLVIQWSAWKQTGATAPARESLGDTGDRHARTSFSSLPQPG